MDQWLVVLLGEPPECFPFELSKMKLELLLSIEFRGIYFESRFRDPISQLQRNPVKWASNLLGTPAPGPQQALHGVCTEFAEERTRSFREVRSHFEVAPNGECWRESDLNGHR